jgi:hypothetical protein
MHADDLPTLDRLTHEVRRAMVDAERRERQTAAPQRRWRSLTRHLAIALALLAVLVPSAVAVRAVIVNHSDVDVPAPSHPHVPASKLGPAVVVGEGRSRSAYWTLVARRCGDGLDAPIAIATILGEHPRVGGIGVRACPTNAAARFQTISQGTAEVTINWGLLPSEASHIVLRLATGKDVTLPALPIPTAAAQAGGLPNLRYFVLPSPGARALPIRMAVYDDLAHALYACSWGHC